MMLLLNQLPFLLELVHSLLPQIRLLLLRQFGILLQSGILPQILQEFILLHHFLPQLPLRQQPRGQMQKVVRLGHYVLS